jgi:SARP family transcriptional regulator, regulator of embCAB operon
VPTDADNGLMTVAVGLLGPVTLAVDGHPVRLGGARPRAVLAALAAGSPAPAERLAEWVWSDTGRPSSRTALHVHVHTVRQALGRHAELLRHTSAGYALVGAEIDVVAAADRIRDARAADEAGDPVAAAGHYRTALALWRGEFCADLRDHDAFTPARAVYDAMRLDAVEARVSAELRAGEIAGAAAELESLVAEHPLREGFWAQLMVARHRQGRQADALECYRRARATLAAEAGVDPGSALRSLQRAVLAHAGTTTVLGLGAPGPGGTDRPALAWVDDEGRPRRRDLLPGPGVTIGRGLDADVALPHDPAVSRRHALVETADGHTTVRDLGSSNGTYRNLDRVGPDGAELWPGDLLRCGDTVLAVTLPPTRATHHADETRPPQRP